MSQARSNVLPTYDIITVVIQLVAALTVINSICCSRKLKCFADKIFHENNLKIVIVPLWVMSREKGSKVLTHIWFDELLYVCNRNECWLADSRNWERQQGWATVSTAWLSHHRPHPLRCSVTVFLYWRLQLLQSCAKHNCSFRNYTLDRIIIYHLSCRETWRQDISISPTRKQDNVNNIRMTSHYLYIEKKLSIRCA